MSKLEDLESDIRHLYHLLDTLCDQQFGVGAMDPDQRERCDALLWIARDRADMCKNQAHALLLPGGGVNG